MAICKYCGVPFQWASTEDGWKPLVPIGEDEGLDREFQDENGELRASHRLICTIKGGSAVRAVKLAKPIPASSIVTTYSAPDEHGEIQRNVYAGYVQILPENL